jgi:DNA invertase Pin-like site-specific DNA recombinase
MTRHIAIYCRVSSRRQDTRSQERDLMRWTEAYADGAAVVWYRDKATGKTMDRPGWRKVEAAIAAGQITKLVCWRLDRLGRTASGLTALFDTLRERKLGLVSIRDGFDLQTSSGRLMANVLASVAAYENEVRSERIVAGQAVARARGKRWGGSRPGVRKTDNDTHVRIIHDLRAQGTSIANIARTLRVSRPTVYSVLAEGGDAAPLHTSTNPSTNPPLREAMEPARPVDSDSRERYRHERNGTRRPVEST